MKSKLNVLATLLFLAAMPSMTGCELLGMSFGEDDAASDPASDTGGGGATLATADLDGDWDTPCIAKGSTSGPSGYAGYRDWLGVTGTTFFMMRAWYTTMTGVYCSGSLDMDAMVAGTVAVGGLATGSSSLSTIQFTITTSEIRGYNGTIRTALNSACALSLTTSSAASVLGNSCGGGGYVANASSGAVVDNVVSLSGTTLMLGAMSNSMYIPGVLTGGTVATSSTIPFIKR